VILVLASRFDAGAASLVRRWHEHDARLLTCDALGRRGWVFNPADPSAGSLVVGADVVSVREVEAAVSFLPYVNATELPHIAPDDQDYVASEAMAFLVSWLSEVPCRKLNQPHALNLSGPHLAPAQWVCEASRTGLRVRAWERNVPTPVGKHHEPDPTSQLRTVSVVGGNAIATPFTDGLPDEIMAGAARLARNVEAGMLSATFIKDSSTDWEFMTAIPVVDPAAGEVADAMLDALAGAA
jgi:hypothetical protein